MESTVRQPNLKVSRRIRSDFNRKKRNFLNYLLILPIFLYMVILFVIPLIIILAVSFFDPTFTLKNYAAFFSVPAYLIILKNTFVVSIEVTILCLILAYPVSYVLASVKGNLRSILLLFVLVPFWMSFIIRSFTWIVILQRQGVVNSILMGLHIIQSPLQLVGNQIGVIIGMVHVLLPFMILPLFNSIASIDPDLTKAAQSLGCRSFTNFLKIMLPLSIPGIVTGSLLVFIIALGYYITPQLLGGSSSTMISQLIVTEIGQQLNWGFGSAIAVVLLVCVSIVLVVFNRFLSADKVTFTI